MRYLLLLVLLIVMLSGSLYAADCDNSVARVTALSDALVNGTASAEQKLALASAFTKNYKEYVISRGKDPDNLSNEMAACLVLIKITERLQEFILHNNESIAAARVNVADTEEAVDAMIKTDWPSGDIPKE